MVQHRHNMDPMVQQLEDMFARCMAGGRVLLIPVAWVLFVRLILFPGEQPTNHVLHDTYGHLIYYAAFLFGFAWARTPGLQASIPSLGKWAGVLALFGYAAIVGPRLILLAEPPSIDKGEVTDKGSINQRAVLKHRDAEVQALHGDTLPFTLKPQWQ